MKFPGPYENGNPTWRVIVDGGWGSNSRYENYVAFQFKPKGSPYYAYDASRPLGQRVDRTSVRIDGAPLLPDRTYRVATSNFLWGGGDDVTALGSGTDPVTVGVDVEIAAAYFSRREG